MMTKNSVRVIDKSTRLHWSDTRAGTSPGRREVELWKRSTTRALSLPPVGQTLPRTVSGRPKLSELQLWVTMEFLVVVAMEAFLDSLHGTPRIDCQPTPRTVEGAHRVIRKAIRKNKLALPNNNIFLPCPIIDSPASPITRTTPLPHQSCTVLLLPRNNAPVPLPLLQHIITLHQFLPDPIPWGIGCRPMASPCRSTYDLTRMGLDRLSKRFKAQAVTNLLLTPLPPRRLPHEGKLPSRFLLRRPTFCNIRARTAPRQQAALTRFRSLTGSKFSALDSNAPLVPKVSSRRSNGLAPRSLTLIRQARVGSRAKKI